MDDAERDGHVESVAALVAARDYVTYVEIAQHLEGRGVATAGHMAICLPADENVILWAGMSAEFVAVMHALQQGKRIFPHPAQPLVYLVDGEALRFPLALRRPKGGYRTPHWAPVTFRTTRFTEADARRYRARGTPAGRSVRDR